MLRELLEANDFMNMGNLEAAAHVMRNLENQSRSRKETERAWKVLSIMRGSPGRACGLDALNNAMWGDDK